MPLTDRDLQERLREAGVAFEILHAPRETPTAQSAADAFGVPVERIVKSLLFANRESGEFALVVAGGATRVDAATLGPGRWTLARPADVERVTGYAVGTVPPVGHATRVRVVVDARVAALDGDVIGGGGSPHASLRIRAADVVKLTGADMRDAGA